MHVYGSLVGFVSQGSIVSNILEPSAVSGRDYAKRAKKSHALRT